MNDLNLTFLGTCACDFSPKLKDECLDCFDKDARRASSALLNGHFLIDCGPHCIDSLRIAGVDTSAITDIFITHLHWDHFIPENIEKIATSTAAGVRLWVSADADVPSIKNVTVMRMEKLTEYGVSTDIKVVGLYANHDAEFFPQHLLFKCGEKKFLYALDGAWFINASYNYLKKIGLDLLVFDATCGDYVGDFRLAEHNSIPMIRLMLPSLKKVGIVNDTTEIYLSHLAPSLHKPHIETVDIVKADGLLVAYDGLSVSI